MACDLFPEAALSSFNALQAAYPEAPEFELQRFACARPAAPDDAVAMYSGHVQWRRTSGRPECLTEAAQACSRVAPLLFSGMRSQGLAKDGTGVIFIEIGRYDKTESVQTYTLALCHALDEALPREEAGQVTVVMDVRAVQGCPNPTPMELMSFAAEVVKVLPKMYPERLRRVIVYPVPWWASMIVNLIKKMLDAKTCAKLIIVAGDDTAMDCPADELSEFLSIESLPRRCWFKNKSLGPDEVSGSLDPSSSAARDVSRANAADDEEDDMSPSTSSAST